MWALKAELWSLNENLHLCCWIFRPLSNLEDLLCSLLSQESAPGVSSGASTPHTCCKRHGGDSTTARCVTIACQSCPCYRDAHTRANHFFPSFFLCPRGYFFSVFLSHKISGYYTTGFADKLHLKLSDTVYSARTILMFFFFKLWLNGGAALK